jgi:hypothetical protein
MRATPLIVAFILSAAQVQAYADEYAVAPNQIGGNTYLTDEVCRFDKRLLEAYTTNAKGTRTYACYWFGVTKVFFEPEDRITRSLPKSNFKSIKSVI